MDDEADAKEDAEDAKDAEDEDNVVSEEEEEEEEDESHEDDDADEHDAAAHLHVRLTSKECEKIWSQETLLLETVRRQKCQRWSLFFFLLYGSQPSGLGLPAEVEPRVQRVLDIRWVFRDGKGLQQIDCDQLRWSHWSD